MSKNDRSNVGYFSGDKPILSASQDKFDVKPRVVNKVMKFLSENYSSALTVAITGEWGVGKTSVMNLLAEALRAEAMNNGESDIKQSIVIEFEPLLEGKFEVLDIMEFFYLKLYAAFNDKSAIKPILKQLLQSIGAIIFTGSNLKASIPLVNSVAVDLDLDKKYEAILEIWAKKESKSFSQQAADLNKFFSNQNIRIIVFIDEIDRLPAEHIINFLMFARILENFSNLICVIGIDYERVVNTLKSCPTYCLQDYEGACSYLDKLFHVDFHVVHNFNQMLTFLLSELNKIIKIDYLSSIHDVHRSNWQDDLEEIIKYLSTPRQVKKLLTLVSVHRELIEYSSYSSANYLIPFLMLFSICVKHPIIYSNLSKYTLPFLRKGPSKSTKSNKESEDKILHSTGLGAADKSVVSDEFDPIFVKDATAFSFMSLALKKISNISLLIIITGCNDKNLIELLHNYFVEDIDKSIQWLINNYNIYDDHCNLILQELNDGLRRNIHPDHGAEVDLLNRLWIKMIIKNPENYNFKTYHPIVLRPLNNHPVEKILSEAVLSLLAEYISQILKFFNVENCDGECNLNLFKKPENHLVSIQYGLHNINFEEKNINDFDQNHIKSILNQWISRVEDALNKHPLDLVDFNSGDSLLRIFFRYVQWSVALNHLDKKERILKFFEENINIPACSLEDKEKIIDALKQVCISYRKMGGANPIEILLGNSDAVDETIKNLIMSLANRVSESDYVCINQCLKSSQAIS